jgi:hypothetical protein
VRWVGHVAHGRYENSIQNVIQKTLGELGIDGKIILK